MVAYAGKSLTETEERYSQIEREALTILFSCTKLQVFFKKNIFK